MPPKSRALENEQTRLIPSMNQELCAVSIPTNNNSAHQNEELSAIPTALLPQELQLLAGQFLDPYKETAARRLLCEENPITQHDIACTQVFLTLIRLEKRTFLQSLRNLEIFNALMISLTRLVLFGRDGLSDDTTTDQYYLQPLPLPAKFLQVA